MWVSSYWEVYKSKIWRIKSIKKWHLKKKILPLLFELSYLCLVDEDNSIYHRSIGKKPIYGDYSALTEQIE